MPNVGLILQSRWHLPACVVSSKAHGAQGNFKGCQSNEEGACQQPELFLGVGHGKPEAPTSSSPENLKRIGSSGIEMSNNIPVEM